MSEQIIESTDDLEVVDDFADLDAFLDTHAKGLETEKALRAKRSKMGKGGLSELDKGRLLAEIRTLEEGHVWITVASVALFHTQICETCGHTHRFFKGWMTQQDHKHDKNCRRLRAGKAIGNYPSRIEDHAQGLVPMCGDCAEVSIILDQFLGGPNE